MTWHKLKAPLRVGSIFLKPENRSVPKFMNMSYISYTGARTNLK